MQSLLVNLQKLDHLYHTGSFAEYEQHWQRVEQQVQQMFPGFTIAYAEIYSAGEERHADGAMRHVLVPLAKL